ncbi:MAG: NADH-quinone oxidoreductase subunit C [Actinomycetota bacterium]|nr:NADH-quinone oxidoreductase subunit C [Actinomycetota bacterium]
MSSPDTTTDQASATDPGESAVDERREALVNSLAKTLGEALVATEIQPGVDVWIRVVAEAWAETARVLRDHCDMAFFNFLSAVDWQPSPYGREMDAVVDRDNDHPPADVLAPEWGTTGGEQRFQLLARVHDPVNHLGVHIKSDLDGDRPEVDSWTPIYPGADWHEREAWEMFGITFHGHPNLVHLYLPSEFEGHPLRKDYPLLARRVRPWPGIVDVELMPGEDVVDDEETDDGDDL